MNIIKKCIPSSASHSIAYVTATLSLLCFSSSLSAETFYKWKNANGSWEYGSHPPPNSNAQKVITYSGGSRAKDNTEKSFTTEPAPAGIEKQDTASSNNTVQKQASHKNPALRKENCNNAKANLESLQSNAIIRKRDAQGNLTVLSDKQREDELREAKRLIRDNC